MPLLTWRDRDADLTRAALAPYRLLQHDPALSYGDQSSPNMLIQGDNLDALKALLPYFAGQVKCIFIDPPYNTTSEFEHYADNLEHSVWLSMMYPRLELIRDLLREDGSLWITIDDNECHYLKVICDEIFGRGNFVASIAWQKAFAKKNKAVISGSHDHLLVYAKAQGKWKRNLLPRGGGAKSAFKNLDNDPRGVWQSVAYSVQSEDGDKRAAYRYPITLPSGRSVNPPVGRHWNGLEDRTAELRKANRLWFGKKGDNPPRMKVFLSEVQEGIVPDTWWSHKDAGSNQDAKKEILALFLNEEPISTPKPEALMARILTVATNPGDLVLDSFLGSGTTAAVAHKMGRSWIGVDLGEHAETLCQRRLVKVVDGEGGGVSKQVGWEGGGGFRFFTLGASLFDEAGNVRAGTPFAHLAAHVWFSETKVIRASDAKDDVLLGVHEGTAYYLLYGDPAQLTSSTLTRSSLRKLAPFDGPKVVFGEACLLSDEQLEERQISFKQIPYDLKAR
jgi:adenine-specific DNA-methyltransferase